MGTSKSVELIGHQLGAGQRLNDDVETGQNGVGLGQEVAVAHQLVLGNAGELTEHLLIFRMRLDEAEENLRSDIAVSAGLVPGLADDATVVGAQNSSIAFIISGDGGDGSGDGGSGSSRLYKYLIELTSICMWSNELKFSYRIRASAGEGDDGEEKSKLESHCCCERRV
jgi:hypothetical protein